MADTPKTIIITVAKKIGRTAPITIENGRKFSNAPFSFAFFSHLSQSMLSGRTTPTTRVLMSLFIVDHVLVALDHSWRRVASKLDSEPSSTVAVVEWMVVGGGRVVEAAA